MASPPNFPKFGPTPTERGLPPRPRTTQSTAAAPSGSGTGQLSARVQSQLELLRQELAKNGITPEIQARFRKDNPNEFTGSVEPVAPSEPPKQGATAPTLAPTQPGEPPKLDFAKFANDERARLQDKIEQLKKDPKYAWLTRGALGPDILQKAFSQAGGPTPPSVTNVPATGASASKPWAAADWVQQKQQGFQRDTKLAQALSPKKEKPYRLNIAGDKVQSMQLPAYGQSMPATSQPSTVQPSPAAALSATSAPRAKRQPRQPPKGVQQVKTTKVTKYK